MHAVNLQAEFLESNKEFSKWAVHTYKHWQLQVHENQGALGRCVFSSLSPFFFSNPYPPRNARVRWS
jgi:hypothetical protein